MIDRKLRLLQADYDLVKKYDNITIETQTQSVAPIVDKDLTKIDDFQDQDKPPQKEVQDEEDEQDDEFGEYQYECMDDDDCATKNDLQVPIDPSTIQHIDPFDKPLDCELIKNIMSKFQLPGPEWANNKDQWKSKLEFLMKENIETTKQDD